MLYPVPEEPDRIPGSLRRPSGNQRDINVFRRALLLTTAVLALVPLGAVAQALPWPEQARAEAQLLPVLSRSDGRLEALLLLDSTPSVNPLDRVFAPRTRLGAAARVQLDSGDTVEAALKLDRGSGLALLCNEQIGLATTLGSLSEHCLLAKLSASQQDTLWSDASRASSLEGGWSSDRLGVDLTFGLGWLDSGTIRPATPGALELAPLGGILATSPLAAGTLVPFAVGLPELAGARLVSRSIGVRGLFDLGSQRWLSLGGSVSRNRFDPGLLGGDALRRWDSSALSVGLGQGNLYGELTGHMADLPGTDAAWGGLDVGISWRMPWQAELTFGARNLLSTGSNPWLVDQSGEPLDEAESRVPYVRYHQDL